MEQFIAVFDTEADVARTAFRGFWELPMVDEISGVEFTRLPR